MRLGIVFASTGGYKTVRALRSFLRMEPEAMRPHVVIDRSSNSWNQGGKEYLPQILQLGDVRLVENHAHINGTLNRGMEWMEELGFTHVALFHDDIVFSSLPEHQGSFSVWLTPELLAKSAITFCHLECFKHSHNEPWARRHPSEWDNLDLESQSLWEQLGNFQRENAYRIQPEGADWYCHYEGCDKVRKWNRLGPTGQVVPIETWQQVGKFDEVDCVHYDQDYTVKCFRIGLVPNYAVPNVPWLHLHNQSMNPWFDPAPGEWGRREAMIRKFGADWPGIWVTIGSKSGVTKVLYLSGATGADYQCDMLFHGLRTLLGPDCVDVNKLTFMYQGEPYPPFYTVYGLLPDIPVDREDISGKLEARYFDLVIYGSIHRFSDHLDGVRRLYPSNRIVFIDGEDDHGIVSVRGQGFYFKRELEDSDPFLMPIEFAIPREKIIALTAKTRLMAPCDPRDRTTYQFYGDESVYYRQYAESYFGYTMRKGGWDCCRHYEIMAAGCMPYFAGLEECPERTMWRLPKNVLLKARKLHDAWDGKDIQIDEWHYVMTWMRDYFRDTLTTEAMAKYVLDTVAAA